MRVVYLTAGAAGMYCGSCMHDNSLARAMIQNGTDCVLVPTYTPIRTDEQDVSTDRVFFGGVNIYLEQMLPMWGSMPRWMTRWLDSPSLIRFGTRKSVQASPKLMGDLTVSMLRGTKGRQRSEVSRLCDWLEQHARPDAIVLSNFLIGGCVEALKERFGVPILVTLQGDDIFLDYLPQQAREESISLMHGLAEHVDRFVVNSKFYGNKMGDILSLESDRMHVVPLGIDVAPYEVRISASQSTVTGESSDPLKLGYLARIDKAKGLHRLVDAFIQFSKLGFPSSSSAELHVAGWLGEHNADYAAEQWKRLDEAGLQGRYKYHGSPEHDTKIRFLQQLDLFCVPTEYAEPKGLFALEAMAMQLPVVVPNHGTFPELIDESTGGVLVSAGDTGELANTIGQLLEDSAERSRLGCRGREYVLTERRVDRMAVQLVELIESLTPRM